MSCDFCAHYCNFHPPANLRTVDEAVKEWRRFSDKLMPEEFAILGGDPTLHPNLCDLIEAAKEVWSHSNIRLTTNGFFLDRHPRLGEVLAGGLLIISLHWRYQKEEASIRRQAHELQKQGVEVRLFGCDEQGMWLQFYQLVDGVPKPFLSDPEKAYEACPSKYCLTLRNGAIYKCPQVACAGTVGIEWESFKSDRPLLPDGDFEEFLGRKAEACCSHCPESRQFVQLSDPRKKVERRNFSGT